MRDSSIGDILSLRLFWISRLTDVKEDLGPNLSERLGLKNGSSFALIMVRDQVLLNLGLKCLFERRRAAAPLPDPMDAVRRRSIVPSGELEEEREADFGD